ncbi:MAG: hypothetical protein PF588_02700 [Candidatus Kapabacteria bacterium]|jgi:hypothetical protein|nr:hypothetical protein [Candidatus Kapabacteria bacterium]
MMEDTDDDEDADPAPDISELADDQTARDSLIYIAAKGDPMKYEDIQEKMTWAELLRFVSAERAFNYRPPKKEE